jgi:hypothetical protein
MKKPTFYIYGVPIYKLKSGDLSQVPDKHKGWYDPHTDMAYVWDSLSEIEEESGSCYSA